MRKSILIMKDWQFTGPDGSTVPVDLPHTWNNFDGQDGGNNYWRGSCTYEKQLPPPPFDPAKEFVYLRFDGVNSSADVELNGIRVAHHDGGYSTFYANVSALLQEENRLCVTVDNGVNDRVYPQKADFTFYGGIYRDVSWVVVPQTHLTLDRYFAPGVQIIPDLKGPELAIVELKVFVTPDGADKPCCKIVLSEEDGTPVGEALLTEEDLVPIDGETLCFHTALNITRPHLWNGVADPYLYRAEVTLLRDGEELDGVARHFGVRSFKVDPQRGFFLNGKHYPLRGVSRHQDRRDLGNALTHEMMEEDMALIREIGANTIRLAHYQHDQYFYDLCDRYGMIVWAEIPYISEHMATPEANENTRSQMRELIYQNFNHPCIICWGISNEITISTKNQKDMLANHRALQELCHELDPTRPTTMACYAMCGPLNPVTKITDLVSWNLYLGWYVPILALNDILMPLYHVLHPRQPFGYSEYGAEGMPNLHSSKPRRGDHSEEYQAKYHEYMLHCFQRHPYLWATHVWNMFDFAADARNQGGEPGMNHKGLVTFDRKIKKDSFYVYKAFWTHEEPFIHICGKRYEERIESYTEIKLYTNRPETEVCLYVNDRLYARASGRRIYRFYVPLRDTIRVRAELGDCRDEAEFTKTTILKQEYRLLKEKLKSANWV